MIRLGTPEDLDRLLEITQACGKHLRDQGIDQWDENYPDVSSLQGDISTGTLYVYEEDESPLGLVVLNELQDEEYGSIDWSTSESDRNLIVHRLGVDPNFQGRGIARKLMDFAESFAKSKGFAAIRLDTFTQNPRNQRFYENRGYTKLGEVYLKYKKEHRYICYELCFN